MPPLPVALNQAVTMPVAGKQPSEFPEPMGPKNEHGAQGSVTSSRPYNISDLLRQAVRMKLLKRSSAIPRISEALLALPLLLCLGTRYLTQKRIGTLNVISGASIRLTFKIKCRPAHTVLSSYFTRLPSHNRYHLALNFPTSNSLLLQL